MKRILLLSALLVGFSVPIGDAKVNTASYECKIMTHKLTVYYKSIGKRVDPTAIEHVITAIDKYCEKYFPNKQFVRQDFIALAMLESDFHQYEVGTSGEVGVFQIMKMHIPKYIRNPFDISINTRLAMRVLRDKFEEHRDYKKAIIAYNGIVRLKRKHGAWSEKYWNSFQARKELLTEIGIF
jgi:hypothetical protein